MNRRLAAHKSRQSAGAAEVAPAEARQTASTRGAQAAARVAARYAKAPTHSQMLAEEARAAVRAAEAASQAALKAQAAAESVLAGLETASIATPEVEQEPHSAPAQHAHPKQATFFDPFLEVERPVMDADGDGEAQALQIRWDPDMPVRGVEPAAARAPHGQEHFGVEIDEWPEPATNNGEPETVEPAQPIHANLIEFPRELVATRKARPRIAEGPLAPAGGECGQLSIFEVDPGTISIRLEPAEIATEPLRSGWSRIHLDAEPEPEVAQEPAPVVQRIPLRPAPLGLRLLAALVDGALTGALFVLVAFMAVSNLHSPLSIKAMELTAALALGAIAALYQAFFLTFAQSTPGMRYAGICFSTFDGATPTRGQLRRRLCASILSLLPAGLGLLWAIFDEDHLSWHDRISRTYQR